MKRIAVLIITAFFLAGAWLYVSGEHGSATSTLKSYQIQSTGLKSYNLDSYSEKKVAGIDKTEIIAVKDTSRFEIDIYSGVGREFAYSFIRDRKNEITSMYTDKPAPYEGIPERNIECRKGYVVNITEVSGGNYTKYSLYADEGYNLGACSEEEAKYRAEIVVGYCSSSEKLFESRSFVKEGSTLSHPQVTCKE